MSDIYACGPRYINPEAPPLVVKIYAFDHARQSLRREQDKEEILFSESKIENFRALSKEDLKALILDRDKCLNWELVRDSR